MTVPKHSPESQSLQLSSSKIIPELREAIQELRKTKHQGWDKFRRKDIEAPKRPLDLSQYRSQSVEQDKLLANRLPSHRPSAFFSTKYLPKENPKKTRKVSLGTAIARLTQRKRHGLMAWFNLRSAGIEAGSQVPVAHLMEHGRLSRDRAYECVKSGVFASRKVAHGKMVAIMPTGTAVLELLGLRRWQGAEWLKTLIDSGIADIDHLEAELLRLRLETSDRTRHAMAALAEFIGRSIPTARKRLARLVEAYGLTITANYIELSAVSLREAAGLMQANHEGGVYWWIELRHQWLDDKKRLLCDGLLAGWQGYIEQGFEAVAVRRTVNSFHFEQ